MALTFEEFPKIARLNRECVITEKIDGTNGSVIIGEDGEIAAASRSRILDPGSKDDNFGFGAWVTKHADELRALGPGRHFGEWWGSGIQRRYGLTGSDKRFSLFNVARWSEARPACCLVVPVLYRGIFSTNAIDYELERLSDYGSVAAPGFLKPEGVIVWHDAARVLFKATIEKDSEWKGKSA